MMEFLHFLSIKLRAKSYINIVQKIGQRFCYFLTSPKIHFLCSLVAKLWRTDRNSANTSYYLVYYYKGFMEYGGVHVMYHRAMLPTDVDGVANIA